MSTSITILADVDSVVQAAFSHDDSGHVRFGFVGRSAEPVALDSVVHAPVLIQDYQMERGIKYSVRLLPAGANTNLLLSDVADDRVESVVWFARKHLLATGLALADPSGDSSDG